MAYPTQIFIHYFNPELLRAYGVGDAVQKSEGFLKKTITTTKLAFLISELPLLVPVSSIFEGPHFKDFLDDIRPIINIYFIKYISPTAEIGKYAEKKIREFHNQPELYPNYTSKKDFSNFINLVAGIHWQPRIKRSASKEISEQWKGELENFDGLWKQILKDEKLRFRNISKIENSIHTVPEKLDGRAFVLYNAESLIPFKIDDRNSTKVNLLINKAFVESYIYEYQASIIVDSPIGKLDCEIKPRNNGFQPTFSFAKITGILKMLGIDTIISAAFSWDFLIELKFNPYFEWLMKFLAEGYKSGDAQELKQIILRIDFQAQKNKIIQSKKSILETAREISMLVYETYVREKSTNFGINRDEKTVRDNYVPIEKKEYQMKQSEFQIVAIASGWGAKYGGINSLNFELCGAFAQRPDIKMICVLPYVENYYQVQDNVHLIGIYSNPDNEHFSEGWELILEKRLMDNGFDIHRIDFCIGHDTNTGNQALKLRKLNTSIKTIIISHQAFELYTASKNNDGAAATRKGNEQLKVYQQADLLLCVGPLLFNFFKGKHQLYELKQKGRIVEFVPGLLETMVSRANPDSFALTTMGRFEPENGDLKGMSLIVDSFALACKEARQLLGSNPMMTIFGLSNDATISSKQSIDIINQSSRLSNNYIAINPSPYTTNRNALLDQVRNSSCVAMLSLQEGFGLVGWETIACEIPLLLSENTGLFKLLKQKRLENLAYFVSINRNESDKASVKEKIKEIAGDYKNARVNAASLLAELKKEYTWPNVITGLLQQLEHLII